MKLLFYLAVWKRPEITEICFMGLNRLRRLAPIDVLAVISEESMIPLCEKYSIDYCFYKNEPLGEKKNFGLRHSLEKEWDYFVELGSDDLIKNEYLDHIKGFQGDLLCVDHFAYINSENLEVRTYKTKSFYGLGRLVKRSVVEKVHEFWPSQQNRGMDNGSMFHLCTVHGIMPKQIKLDKPVAIDIKSKENLWSFNPDLGTKANLSEVLKGLSEEEKNAILSLNEH